MMSPAVPRARAVEVGIAVIGIALVACAVGARQTWLDRHFLPSFFLPRHWYVLIETVVRVSLGSLGMLLAVVARPRLARVIAKRPGDLVRIVVAIVLALAAGEWVMRHVHLGPTEWLSSEEEPRRVPDERLGWVLMRGRTGRASIGGRGVDYAIDPAGYRVRRMDDPVDLARPTLVFAGESVMFGEGLLWDETIPAQVSARLGVPVANLAVHGSRVAASSDLHAARVAHPPDRPVPRRSDRGTGRRRHTRGTSRNRRPGARTRCDAPHRGPAIGSGGSRRGSAQAQGSRRWASLCGRGA
jgi:hypothetical protein